MGQGWMPEDNRRSLDTDVSPGARRTRGRANLFRAIHTCVDIKAVCPPLAGAAVKLGHGRHTDQLLLGDTRERISPRTLAQPARLDAGNLSVTGGRRVELAPVDRGDRTRLGVLFIPRHRPRAGAPLGQRPAPALR